MVCYLCSFEYYATSVKSFKKC